MNKLMCGLCIVLILLNVSDAFNQRKTPAKKMTDDKIKWNLEYYEAGEALKISSETQVLPKEFHQHDIIKLFQNLESALAKKNNVNADALKGKKILGDLTADDLFIFGVEWDDRKFGIDARNENFTFKGFFYGLDNNSEFEPQNDAFSGCGVGSGELYPRVDSKNDLITKVSPRTSPDEFWKNVHFEIESFKPIYDKKSYKGKLIVNADYPDCSLNYIVPSPQIFYQLAFNAKQPYQLVEVEDYVFDLDDYKYKRAAKTGIVAWESDIETDARDIKHFFAVKLVPPFIRTAKLEKFNAPENKNVVAFVKQIVVEIQGIWAVDEQTGKILSKEIGQKADK